MGQKKNYPICFALHFIIYDEIFISLLEVEVFVHVLMICQLIIISNCESSNFCLSSYFARSLSIFSKKNWKRSSVKHLGTLTHFDLDALFHSDGTPIFVTQSLETDFFISIFFSTFRRQAKSFNSLKLSTKKVG